MYICTVQYSESNTRGRYCCWCAFCACKRETSRSAAVTRRSHSRNTWLITETCTPQRRVSAVMRRSSMAHIVIVGRKNLMDTLGQLRHQLGLIVVRELKWRQRSNMLRKR